MTLRTVSAVQALADELRSRILSGDVEPGASMPEQDLAREFGVARPTAREAVAVLVHEGYLRRERHRSARVPRLTADDVRDLMFVRRPLDHAVASTILGQRVPAAEEALAELEREGAWSQFVKHHAALHTALTEAAGSARLLRLYASLEAETQLGVAGLRILERTALVREHRELLDAIASGDGRRAGVAVDAHIESSWRELAASLG